MRCSAEFSKPTIYKLALCSGCNFKFVFITYCVEYGNFALILGEQSFRERAVFIDSWAIQASGSLKFSLGRVSSLGYQVKFLYQITSPDLTNKLHHPLTLIGFHSCSKLAFTVKLDTSQL